ncbi:DEAD/DEAH box helicase [Urechidicola vernalis]|uniref:RNA helicase n=1 Tax=Urechidicola vernalis TaxID=3075600 RepID=A0ABU2Y2B7_9FLAO|nr:DEAD/DEAH box helicase [Urechidicola sp. P050]MDT0551925.1 DEAD/DEAH box helicase [Urechidicola sp. P050]
MASFKELGIQKDYIKGLKELGINYPTEIQESTIPVLLNSSTDLIGLAQTGTGKTAAYGLPLLAQIDAKKPVVQGLILSPTRELAQQIKKQLFKFTKYVEDRIFVEGVYGGEKIEKQIAALERTTHIVVATPGRLIDLIERGAVDLKNLKTVVLDEADEMLSMGFKQDLNRILKYTNGDRNTWLFSATMPDEIKRIVKTYMSASLQKIEVNKNALVNANITHLFVKTTIKQKLDTIMGLLEARHSERGIIFCRTKAGTQNLTHSLKEEGYSVDALEGDMQQRDREKVMRMFKKGTIDVLVSTDVSARGIDVNNLGFVIHHQLPEKNEYYTHRSGRTARAGKAGYSIALILPNEFQRIQEIQKELGIYFNETKV